MTDDYSNGIHNKIARVYFYCNTGLGLLNNFKNLILVIFAGYYALKIQSMWWLLIMFLGGTGLMIVLGWYCVHYLNTVNEWLSIKYGTHFAKRQFALQEEIRDLLKELNKKEVKL